MEGLQYTHDQSEGQTLARRVQILGNGGEGLLV
jgi:hypothetical protein